MDCAFQNVGFCGAHWNATDYRTYTQNRILILLCSLALSTPLRAGELICAGTIEQLIYHANNGFMIRLNSMNAPVFFCDAGSTWTVAGTSYTTSAEQCKALVSLFMAGKLSGKTLSAIYFDGDSVPASCTTWANWQRANVRFFTWAD